MKASRIVTLVLLLSSLCLPDLAAYSQKSQEGGPKVTVTTVQSKPATITQQYTCRIEAQHHIEVRAPVDGYLEEITVKEGQAVKQGDLMFKFVPVLHQARLDSELAEVQIAQVELNNAKRLFDNKVVSKEEIQLQTAKLAKANAKAKVAEAELGFTNVRAPFDGIIDRFSHQQGSLVLKGEALTNLYDNTMVRAYFNVPESRYLEYMAEAGRDKDSLEAELSLANGKKYPQRGKIGAIEAAFNPQTDTIAFRADFPNPDGLLRHGQSGTLLFDAVVKDAILIPQRATFEDQAKRYVYVVDQDRVAHRREIVVHAEMKDLFVVTKGVKEGDVIVDEGVKLVHDGEKVEYEDREPKN